MKGGLHYRILLVEDEPTDLLILRSAFSEEAGVAHEFVEAERLATAEALLAEQKFDAVLLDLGLPDSQGIETFVRLHRKAPDTAIIVLTGFDDEAAGTMAMQLGAQDYILKGNMQSLLLNRSLRYAVERQNSSVEVRQSREQLRLLAGRLLALREDERTRISREIHDELGQQLTGLKMDLRSLERKILPFLDAQQYAAVSPTFADARKLADSTIETVQRIAIELRPGTLDNLGLVATIRDETHRFISRTGINVTVTLPDNLPELSASTATAFFRIFQELVSNVARHSGARAVEVSLCAMDGTLLMVVQDNGRGMPAGVMKRPTSLGLLGMSERAGAVGGQLSFSAPESGGTCATVHAPLFPIQP